MNGVVTVKLKLRNYRSEGNVTYFLIEPGNKNISALSTKERERIARHLPRIFSTAKEHLGGILVETIDGPEPMLTIMTNKVGSPAFRNFEHSLATLEIQIKSAA